MPRNADPGRPQLEVHMVVLPPCWKHCTRHWQLLSATHATTSLQQLDFAHAVHGSSKVEGAQSGFPLEELALVDELLVDELELETHAGAQGWDMHVANAEMAPAKGPHDVHLLASFPFWTRQSFQHTQTGSCLHAVSVVQQLVLAQVTQLVSPGSGGQGLPDELLVVEPELLLDDVLDEADPPPPTLVDEVDPPAPPEVVEVVCGAPPAPKRSDPGASHPAAPAAITSATIPANL